MRTIRLIAAAAALTVSGSAAFAWGDMYMGDGTHDPNSNMLIHSYDAPNHCPSGLQPVMVGGVICCGTPNAGAYVDRPGKARSVHKPAPRRHAPARQMVVGEKGVVFR